MADAAMDVDQPEPQAVVKPAPEQKQGLELPWVRGDLSIYLFYWHKQQATAHNTWH